MILRLVVTFYLLRLTLGWPSSASAEEGSSLSLTSAVMKHVQITEVQAQLQVDAVIAAIRAELRRGNTVEIKNFGRFSVQERKKRKRKGGPANATVSGPTKRYPRFTATESFKAELNARNGY